MPAKPLRMALGSLLIQKQLRFSDRELLEEITENPYLQYFIGLPGYQMESPFVPSLLVVFRKRLTDEILSEINEMIIDFNTPDDPTPGGGKDEDRSGNNEKSETADAQDDNQGTLILDATCAPQNISFPQDINLVNEARENLEGIIDNMCQRYDYRIERYRERTGHYPKRILADKIYPNRENLRYCKQNYSRLSGPTLGRPKKNAKTDKAIEYRDNADRVAVERAFALVKHKYGLGLITSKLDVTRRSSIVLSVIAMNVDRICRSFLRLIFWYRFSRCIWHKIMPWLIQNNRQNLLASC